MIMQAQIGDELTVKGHRQGDEERHGEIIEVHGEHGAPPYLVRWRDGRTTFFFPSADVVIEHHPAGQSVGHVTDAGS
jgi:Domain of unknown function (DUF1918)